MAKHIAFCVFALEVKYVNRKANIIKVMVFAAAEMLQKGAVVVVKDIRRHGTRVFRRESALQEGLKNT